MMIDIFNHFMPKAYLDRLGDIIPGHPVLTGTSMHDARCWTSSERRSTCYRWPIRRPS